MSDNKVGFAGFDDMVSDLSDLRKADASPTTPRAPRAAQATSAAPASQAASSAAKPSAGGSNSTLIFGLAVMGTLLAVVFYGSTRNTPNANFAVVPSAPAPRAESVNIADPASSNGLPVTSGSVGVSPSIERASREHGAGSVASNSAGGSDGQVAGALSPAVGGAKPAYPRHLGSTSNPSPETMPPAGGGATSVFYDPQIRYCLSQSIRLEGAEKAADRTSQSNIDRFNAFVVDYNSRCGHFKYKPGSLERIRVEVEGRRAALESEGVSLMRSN